MTSFPLPPVPPASEFKDRVSRIQFSVASVLVSLLEGEQAGGQGAPESYLYTALGMDYGYWQTIRMVLEKWGDKDNTGPLVTFAGHFARLTPAGRAKAATMKPAFDEALETAKK